MANGATIGTTVSCVAGETMTGGGADEQHDAGVVPALVFSYENPPGTSKAEAVNDGASGGVTLTVHAATS